jgi:hypothetical protein
MLAALCFTALSHLSAQAPARTVTILTTFDYPQSLGTFAGGINDAGDVVGYFEAKSYIHGYERFSDGTMKSIISKPRQYDTVPYGINNSGIVCGGVYRVGFFYDGSMFTFYHMDTTILGINNAGDFVGSVFPADVSSGFASIGGNYITIDIPGAMYTVATGINNRDEIVGYYQDSALHVRGFYRDPAGNLTYPITVHNAIYVALHGINDRGEIVGHWETYTANHGLVMRLPGHIISFDIPGSYLTYASGINNSGEISGGFYDYTGSGSHGFIAQLGQ